MTVWITKYALSVGIIELEVSDISGNEVFASVGGGFMQHFRKEGKDWHRTLEGAQAEAEDMRRKKLASLTKQLGKLSVKSIHVRKNSEIRGGV